MTAAAAPLRADPALPFCAVHASPSDAWMRRPLTVRARGTAWRVATDRACLYAEIVYGPAPDAVDVAAFPSPSVARVLDDMLRRALTPGMPMLRQSRAALEMYARQADQHDRVAYEGGRFDGRRMRLALSTLSDSPWLAAAVTRCTTTAHGLGERRGAGPLDLREGRELMLWAAGARVVAIMNCG